MCCCSRTAAVGEGADQGPVRPPRGAAGPGEPRGGAPRGPPAGSESPPRSARPFAGRRGHPQSPTASGGSKANPGSGPRLTTAVARCATKASRRVQSLGIQFAKHCEPRKLGAGAATRLAVFTSRAVELRDRGGFKRRQPPAPGARTPRRSRGLGTRCLLALRLAAPGGGSRGEGGPLGPGVQSPPREGAGKTPEARGGGEADLPSRGPGASPGPSAGDDHFLEAEGADRTLGTLQGMRMSSWGVSLPSAEGVGGCRAR